MLVKTIFVVLVSALLALPAEATKLPPASNKQPPAQVVKLPYKKCDRFGCKTIKTTLILYEGSKNFTAAEVYQYGKDGMRMAAPISRSYVVSENGKSLEQFYLKNREISVDVNVAGVKCGYNAAFYFSAMNTSAPLGFGYCDAQNTCNEMDIIEANIGSQQFAIHACNETSGACDPWGCGANSYNAGLTKKLGPGGYIDMKKTFTVVTAFHTDTKTDRGTMNSVTQTFIQDGKVFSFDRSTQDTCAGGFYWPTTGGFPAFSHAFDKGMSMIFSFWGQGPPDGMTWLDGGANVNPACNQTVGPNHAMFSNLVVRPITFHR